MHPSMVARTRSATVNEFNKDDRVIVKFPDCDRLGVVTNQPKKAFASVRVQVAGHRSSRSFPVKRVRPADGSPMPALPAQDHPPEPPPKHYIFTYINSRGEFGAEDVAAVGAASAIAIFYLRVKDSEILTMTCIL